MKTVRAGLVVLCILTLFVGSVSARDVDRNGRRIMRALSDDENPALVDEGIHSLLTSATVDSYCIVWFDFEQMDWQGFTVVDNTAQRGTFFHVDDFAGLGGGSYGNLYAPEGAKAMWCAGWAGERSTGAPSCTATSTDCFSSPAEGCRAPFPSSSSAAAARTWAGPMICRRALRFWWTTSTSTSRRR